jgi:hypothetical protein
MYRFAFNGVVELRQTRRTETPAAQSDRKILSSLSLPKGRNLLFLDSSEKQIPHFVRNDNSSASPR